MKRMLSIFLALLLLFSGCARTNSDQPSSLAEYSRPLGFDQPPANRTEVPFEQMEYVQPDLDETIARYKDFAERVQKAQSAEEVMSVWEEETQLCREYYNMFTLSNVLFSLDTTNEDNAANYQYMQDFMSRLRPASIELTRSIVSSPYRGQLESMVGPHVLEAMDTSAKNYSEQQLELELEENRLTTQYTQLLSQATVFETEQRSLTVSDMYYFLRFGQAEDQQIAKQLLDRYYSQFNRQCGEIYSQLVELRVQIAKAAGFDSYLDYYYFNRSYRGYSQRQIEDFRQWVKAYLVPVYRQLKDRAAQRLGRTLNLFEYASPLPEQVNVSYLQTIISAQQLVQIAVGILQDLSPETREMIDYMTRNHLYDLTSAPNKASGAFTTYFYGWQEPYVLSNYDDAGTYIHEMGHALNFFRTGDLRVLEQDLQGSDISEIHSQTLELLASPWLDRIYTDPDAAEKSNVFQMFHTILSATMVDEFQHKIYEQPAMTHEERNALYAQLEQAYFGEVDYLGLSFLENGLDWVDIHHLFEQPMYYIEYALSGVVALGFWQDSQEDWDQAFASYIRFVDIPNDVNLPDSLALAGLENIFREETLQALAENLGGYFLTSFS
ncbi:MAG: M3 family oligoendopeptidase [Oscillospiraceae bacterium]|nr:M3 family oligoendopeptidase [Oscillospiraceae bacterium]